MINPKNLSPADFSYTLPEERIAWYPLAERDASRLLIYDKAVISEDIYSNLATYLPPGSLLIFNETKVIEARLIFQKLTGGLIEIFCLEPHTVYPDPAAAMHQREKVLWHCLIGGASKWKHGQILEKKIITGGNEIILQAKYIEKQVDHFVIELAWNNPGLTFAEILHLAGAIPLPPYIKREAETLDAVRYQTIYARNEGSVAAPTAGLHFTKDVFEKLEAKKIKTGLITLHVGAGTFKPVKAESLVQHEMHAEFFSVSRSQIENFLHHLDAPVIAVGTTSLRTIESLYWLGVKMKRGKGQEASGQISLELLQWEPYELASQNIPVKKAIYYLLEYMEQNKLETLACKTGIMIAPGYQVKIAKALITNFHQPESSLLLLVAALIGEDWKKVYQYALQNGFRFLSYGDGSLLWFR